MQGTAGKAMAGKDAKPAPTPAAKPAPVKSEAKPVPAKPAAKSAPVHAAAAKPASVKDTSSHEAKIRTELEATARKLVGQASRTLLPSKKNKKLFQDGREYVASYTEVDMGSVSTDMKKAKAAGHYSGVIRYRERLFECRGHDKKTALTANCEQVAIRNISELVLYDGVRWVY
jgi:hypothetical protein